jgi:cbb3-type cytochrome oxidase subunit 1
MPALTRWYLKSSLVCLVVALLAGAVLALRAVVALPAWLNGLSPVYFHLLMVGWVTQMIFGVVYWMFPKLSPQQPRGSERLGWFTFWALNLGLGLRVVAEPWAVAAPGSLPGALLAGSAVAQFAAGWAFILNTWGRVKER